MALAFWNNGSPRVIRGRKVNLPNGDVVMNPQPDPDNDVYEYVEAGGKAGRFERSTGVSYDNDGWTITATYTKAYVDVADIRAQKAADAKVSAAALLSKDDWQTIRQMEDPGKPSAPAVKQWRKDIRRASDDFEVALDAETDAGTLAGMQPTWPEDPRDAE
jgi:hypothetical protein